MKPRPHRHVKSLTRKLQLSAGVIGLALAALLITPLLFQGYTTRLRARIADVDEVARDAEMEMRAALAREVAAIRGYLLTRDSSLLREYRAVRAQELAARRRLQGISASLDDHSRAALRTAIERSNEWNALNELLARQLIPAEEFMSEIPTQQRRFVAALDAGDELHDQLVRSTAAIRTAIRAAENVWALSGVGLAVLAMISGFMLASLLRTSVMEKTHANTDLLTGLLNRRGFYDAAASELARAARNGHAVTLLAMDLDGFKQINDQQGHDAGDRVLVDVGEGLRQVLRATDTAGRVGGDEFAVLLAGNRFDPPELLVRVFHDRLMVALTRLDCPVTLSIGAVTSDGAAELPDLLAEGDRQMYVAKRAGKDGLSHVDRRRAGVSVTGG